MGRRMHVNTYLMEAAMERPMTFLSARKGAAKDDPAVPLALAD
jgi:hypothetical protein